MITDVKNTIIDKTADLGAATALQVGDIIDLGAEYDIGPGSPVEVQVLIHEAYNKATSEKWDLVTCDTEGGTYLVRATTGTIAIADAPVGTVFTLKASDMMRFVAVMRTEVGTASDAGGVVSAFLQIK